MEQASRTVNAWKVSGMIRSLGWPFYQGGPKQLYTLPNRTTRDEEKERKRRRDPQVQRTAETNAKHVSTLIRQAQFKRNTRLGSKSLIKKAEERERKRRLTKGNLLQHCENAYYEAGLIRAVGYPFYVQAADREGQCNQIVKEEEQERERRVQDTAGEEVARANARKVSNLISSAEESQRGRAQLHAERISIMIISDVERWEKDEQQRRMLDLEGRKLAQENAAKVSQFVSQDFAQRAGPQQPNPQMTCVGDTIQHLSYPVPAPQPIQMQVPTPVQLPAPHQAAMSTYQPATYVQIPNAAPLSCTAPIQSAPVPIITPVPVVAQPFYTSTSLPATTYTPGPWTAQPQYTVPAQTYHPQPVTHSVSAPIPITTPALIDPSASAQHGERERKYLNKEAEKHAKRANKESKRAENDLSKARYYHGIGKPDKAVKHQASAEQHALASKHHQAWANDAVNLANAQPNANANTNITTGSSRPALW